MALPKIKPRVLKNEQKVEAFKMLSHKTQWEVAQHFKLDKLYETKKQAVAYIARMHQKLAEKPWKYKISDDAVAIVAKGMAERRISPPAHESKSVLEKKEYANMDMKDLVKRSSGRAAKILDYKLGQISKSPKKMKEMTMSDLQKLTVTFGIMFDKSQILKGEATENIAIHAKVDSGLTPEQLIELVQKERENNYVNNK